MKILHVVESLHRGAVETWLLRMLRHARARGKDVDWTFYCTLAEPGAMDAVALDLGARIVRSPVPIGDKLEFIRAQRAELRRGRYEVLHCHHDLVSAVYLVAASGLPIRQRIVHVHNADESVLTPNVLKQRLIREPMRRMCLAFADRILGISNHTLDTFLAGRPRRAGRDLVHYYGIDPAPLERKAGSREEFRRKLDLAPESRILLFAGRIVAEKNPLFAVEVLAEMRRIDPAVAGVFVGSGSLDAEIRWRVTQAGLDPACRYLGWRDDLPEIMQHCDWFILPRPEAPKEGFGLTVVEAQLAGLRLLLSRGIADDPLLPTACFRRLALADGRQAWARAAIELAREPAPSLAAAREALKASPMDMDRALDGLLEIHA